MKRWWWLVAVSLALAAPASAAVSADSIRSVTFANGLRLVLVPDPQATAVDVAVWYAAGTRRERPGKSGMAQLFERLMFRGSAHFGQGEHSRRLRAEGGTPGAYAAPDFNCFYETIPPDALELAFRLEADRMTSLVITQEGLDQERQRAEIDRVAQATPVSRGLERLYALAYSGHPYRRSIYGASGERAKLTLEDCRDFYRRGFGPRNAVVTVVGRFDPDRALALARTWFQPLKPLGPEESSNVGPDPPQGAERRAVETAPVSVRVVMAAWRVARRSDPDWPAFNLLSTLLSRGPSSRLSAAWVDESSLCLSVQGGLNARRDESLLYVVAPVSPDADSATVEARLDETLARLAKEPVSAAELERAKRQAEMQAWLGLQTSRDRAEAVGYSLMLSGDPKDLDRQLERTRAVSAADIQRVAGRLGRPGRDLLWILPSGGRR